MHRIKKLRVFAFSKNTNNKGIIEKRKDANSIKKTAIRRKNFICDKIEYCLFQSLLQILYFIIISDL